MSGETIPAQDDGSIVLFDNFLQEDDCSKLQNLLLGSDFPWYYTPSSTYDPEKNCGRDLSFMGHIFVLENEVNSNYYHNLLTYFSKLFVFLKAQPIQVRANLVLRKLATGRVDWHVDKVFEHFVALFYLDDSDAATVVKIRDNEERIESRRGRLALIPGFISHTHEFPIGRDRVVINFVFKGSLKEHLRRSSCD